MKKAGMKGGKAKVSLQKRPRGVMALKRQVYDKKIQKKVNPIMKKSRMKGGKAKVSVQKRTIGEGASKERVTEMRIESRAVSLLMKSDLKSESAVMSALKSARAEESRKTNLSKTKMLRKRALIKKKKLEKLTPDVFAFSMNNDRKFHKKYLGLKKKLQQKRSALKSSVIFVSNIPYGFFGKQMENYFSQFGEVVRCRHVCSTRTGGSCGYGYVKFENSGVAAIVAKTMNGYLTFGKSMKCQVVPPSRLSYKFFYQKPLVEVKRKAAIQKLNLPRSNDVEKRRLQRLDSRYRHKVNKLAGLGINLELLKKNKKIADTGHKKCEVQNGVKEESFGPMDEHVQNGVKEESFGPMDEHMEEVEVKEEIIKSARDKLTAKVQLSLSNADLGAMDTTAKLVMEVDESDNEIQFKTPPHTIKKYVKMTSASPKVGVKKLVKSPGLAKTPKKAKTLNKTSALETTKTPKKAKTPNKTSALEMTNTLKQAKTPNKTSTLETTKTPNKTSALETTKTPKKAKTPNKTSALETTNTPKKAKTPNKTSELETTNKTPNKLKSPSKITVTQEAERVDEPTTTTSKKLNTSKQSPGKLLKKASKQSPGKSLKKASKQSPGNSQKKTPKELIGKPSKKTSQLPRKSLTYPESLSEED